MSYSIPDTHRQNKISMWHKLLPVCKINGDWEWQPDTAASNIMSYLQNACRLPVPVMRKIRYAFEHPRMHINNNRDVRYNTEKLLACVGNAMNIIYDYYDGLSDVIAIQVKDYYGIMPGIEAGYISISVAIVNPNSLLDNLPQAKSTGDYPFFKE